MKDLTCCGSMHGKTTYLCGGHATRWFVGGVSFIVARCQSCSEIDVPTPQDHKLGYRGDFKEITYEEALIIQVMHE
jgi:hypothetical protein